MGHATIGGFSVGTRAGLAQQQPKTVRRPSTAARCFGRLGCVDSVLRAGDSPVGIDACEQRGHGIRLDWLLRVARTRLRNLTSNTPSICTTSGATVTALALGTCSITATIAKDEYYNAGTVTETFEITAVNQDAVTLITITWSADGSASFPGVSGGSGSGAVTYSSTGVCTVTGSGFTRLARGTCDITATKAASGLFSAITTTETVTVAAIAQSSVSFDLGGTSFSGTTATLPSATEGSGSGSFSYGCGQWPLHFKRDDADCNRYWYVFCDGDQGRFGAV